MSVPDITYPVQVDTSRVRIWRGDYFEHTLELLDQNGDPVDLTQFGDTWTAQARMNMADPDTEAVTFTVDAPNAATGLLVLSLDGAATAALVGGKYGFDVQASGGPKSPWTVFTGVYPVDGDYTRA